MATRLQTVLVFLSLAVYLTVGLNCTVDDCDEKPICPPDSELIGGWTCVCTPGRCSPPPACHYKSKRILKHKAAKKPGDCCDIYDCIFPAELNCTGVICSDKEDDCPPDSYSLPKTQDEGECCSKPMGCACLPGPCLQPSCTNGSWLKAIRPGDGNPGSCCPLYQCSSHVSTNMTCSYDGEEVPSGTKWKKSECIECSCNDGLVHCATSIPCPELPPDCPGTRIPPGKCCPVCVFNHNDIEHTVVKPGGCKSTSGIIHENGATWQEDDCTNCTCIDGAHKCQAEMCHQFCADATYVTGECCPRCNGPSVSLPPDNCTTPLNCTLKCSNGYAKDDSGCSICRCKEGECHLKCESGFLKDGSGTEICECAKDCPSLIDCPKKCRHGYKTNKAGCEICKCEHCKPMHHCTKKCPHGFKTNQKGCPTCICKAPELFNKMNNDMSSLDCVTDEGIRRDNGEAWFDNCRQYYCFDGKEMSSLLSCPKVDCQNPIYSRDLCCPICPGNEKSTESRLICYGPSGIRHEGDTWKQGCLDCICHNGSVMCHSEPCPPVLCKHPLQGDCCPVCPEEAQLPTQNITYKRSCGDRQPGEKWRQSECTSCICANGEAICYTQTCDRIDTSCKTLVQLKSQCCLICLDNLADEKICQVGNVSFSIGDEWEPEKYTRCKCGPAHTISCTRTIYEKSCSKTDNPCCTECNGSKNYYWSCCFFTSLFVMFGVVVVLLTIVGAILLYKHRCVQLSKSHQLNICQPTSPAYPYKNVPTYDQTRSPLKSPV